MTPTHQQLIGLLAPCCSGVYGRGLCDHVQGDASGPEGETGSFRYFPGGFWEVTLDRGGRFLQSPWGGRRERAGYVEEDPDRGGRPPRRPPWSLLLPKYSTFLGRAEDDWQIDASRPLVEERGSVTAALTNLEDPQFRGTLTVSVYTNTITSVDLGYMVQALAIVRSEPDDEDLAVLDVIKSSIVSEGADPVSRLASMVVTGNGIGESARALFRNVATPLRK